MRILPAGPGTAHTTGASGPRPATGWLAKAVGTVYTPIRLLVHIGPLPEPPPPNRAVPPARGDPMSRKAVLGTAPVLGGAALGVTTGYLSRPDPPQPAKSLGLRFQPKDRVVIVGNAFAERMQYFGHFETLLHSRFPD